MIQGRWFWAAIGSSAAAITLSCYLVIKLGRPKRSKVKRKHRNESGFYPSLVNLGNTCYANVSLQMLASSKILLDSLGRNPDLLGPLHGLLVQLSVKTQALKVVNPGPHLVELFGGSALRIGEQDAQEFLQLFLQLLSRKLLAKRALPGLQIVNEVFPAPSIWAHMNPFEGILKQEVICIVCQSTSSLRFDPFSILTIPVSESISDSLDHFQGDELIPGYRCSRCSQAVGCRKRLKIVRPPRTFFLHINRIGASATKDSRHVSVYDRFAFNSGTEYILRAVIEHQGTAIGTGHFICYRRLDDKRWQLTSDASARKLTNDQFKIQCQPYILLYEQIK